MKNFSLKQWALISTTIIAIPLLVAQYVLNYSYFLEVQNMHMEQRLSDIVDRAKALLLFPVATDDRNGIDQVIDEIMRDSSVYSVHIKNARGETIAHKESLSLIQGESEELIRKEGVFRDSRPRSGDSLFSVDGESERTYGTFILLLSTAKSDQAIINELTRRSIAFIGIVLVAAFLIYLIMKENHKHARRITDHIKAILHGDYTKETNFSALKEFVEISLGLNNLSSELKEKIADLEKSRSEAISAREKSERANHFKDEFIHIISHEIRSPVDAVTNLVDALDSHIKISNMSLMGMQHYKVCKNASDDLRNIVGQLINFDNLDGSEIKINLMITDIRKLFTEIADLHVRRFREKKINFRVTETESGFPAQDLLYLVDKVKLKQVVNNLVTNALKYTEEGAASLEWKIVNNLLTFECRDSGIGIPEKELNDIFIPFYQIQKNRFRSNAGHGLGLAIVKRLTNAMNGSIDVKSVINVGTVFSVEIPLHEHIEIKAGVEVEDEKRQSELEKHNLRVVVIDDRDDNKYSLAVMLQSLGCIASVFNDPCDALDFIGEEEVDIVFVDLHLCVPNLDGFAVAREIRRMNKPHYISVVCITADTHPSTSEALSDSALDGLIFKPIAIDEVKRYLKSASAAAKVKTIEFKG